MGTVRCHLRDLKTSCIKSKNRRRDYLSGSVCAELFAAGSSLRIVTTCSPQKNRMESICFGPCGGFVGSVLKSYFLPFFFFCRLP